MSDGYATRALLIVLTTFGPTHAIAQDRARPIQIETKQYTLSGRSVRVDVGQLTVPEFRGNPESPDITIAFVRLRSLAERPAAPLIYLAGGPGGSSTSMGRTEPNAARWLPYIEVADVIFIDQRGTGRSERSLRYSAKSVPDDLFVSRESVLQHFIETTREAAEHFRTEGVELRGYTSNEAADDLNDLRVALGYDKMSLFGFSYGTHLALATIR